MPPTVPSEAGSPLARQATWLERYRFALRVAERGVVRSVGDGIVWVEGLPSAAMEELLVFEGGSLALIFHLGRQLVGAILLERAENLTSETTVYRLGRPLSIPAGDAWLGRVVDPLGRPLDGQPAPQSLGRRPLFAPAPPITARDFVHKPLYTGNKVIDTLIPIGKGQRQLIIGDNGVGKTALAVDAVVNQGGKDVYCVYVLIGQKRSTAVQIIETLRAHDAMDHTTVVVADATALPGLKYLAPFAGCALAEAWMWEGKDTLVVFDDLTTHAQAYRELSLLLRRPPGREAYPADIFYLHSRLLERSTCLAAASGGGSMTSLPIVETAQGEIASYIPTNLISITDGQVYLDANLFASGILPAIDVTRSVSRIGGKGQHPQIKDQAGRMKLDYLQFLELEVFTRFSAKLEASIEAKINRGRILREILKQPRLAPLPIEAHMAWLVAFNRGYFDRVPVHDVKDVLDRLIMAATESSLTLEHSTDRWAEAVKGWIEQETVM
ncbi:MAG: F0F1 ATP synthase subunit alpha [Nitrospira sp.]|nr:F0F1 ATP synthase subunit alpha [Nitrospira sp.]MCP9443244.1 F0F1 ATP synthase subunit alpha [Nitrospira sp.]